MARTPMSSRTRRGGTVIALAAVVGIALSGCIPLPPTTGGTNGTNDPDSTPDVTVAPDGSLDFTPTGEDVAADLEQYYAQDVGWAACQGGFTCGTIQTPMDWFNAGDGRSIEVSMIIRPADGEVWGSMLYNPGGPGGSGIEYVGSYAEYLVAPEVLEHYNLVGFDPRGIGQSTPITCYDDPQWLYDWLYEMPEEGYDDVDPLSDETLEDQLEQGSEFGEACLEHTGEALEFMGTEQVASDMDLIRALLGEEQLNYLGVSYGTLIGATFADLFPENVGRFVLDAAVAPDSTDAEGTIFQAGGFELALRNFVEDALTQDDNPFAGDDVDAVMEEISELLDELDQEPIESSDGRFLGSSSMFTAIAGNLYSDSQWSTLRGIFADVVDGSSDTAFAAADQYYGVNPDGTFLDNSYEALVAVNCLDYPAVTDFDEIRDTAEEVQDVAPTLWPDFVGVGACASWPFEATREPHEVTAPGSNPIIVIGGLNDPATPYDWSVRLAEQLESGVLITVDAEGHSQYNQGNGCVDDPVNDYFLNGNAISDDIDC